MSVKRQQNLYRRKPIAEEKFTMTYDYSIVATHVVRACLGALHFQKYSSTPQIWWSFVAPLHQF